MHDRKKRVRIPGEPRFVVEGFTVPLMVEEPRSVPPHPDQGSEDEGSESFFYYPQSRIGKSRFADD